MIFGYKVRVWMFQHKIVYKNVFLQNMLVDAKDRSKINNILHKTEKSENQKSTIYKYSENCAKYGVMRNFNAISILWIMIIS